MNLLALQSDLSAQALLPLQQHLGMVAVFVASVVALLALDLGLLHRNPQAIGWKAAAAGVMFWVALGLAFNLTLYFLALEFLSQDPSPLVASGRLAATQVADPALVRSAAGGASLALALQWLAGYVVELSLSVDNLFVFVVVLRYFAIPAALQHRVLFWGILGAVVLRASFIGLGVAVLHQFEWVSAFFGLFLLGTGAKMLWHRGDDDLVEPSKTLGFRLLRRVLPLHPQFDGTHFFSRVDARLVATPLLAALVVIEFSDIVFAVDSVPAVLAITREPIVAFTSNIAAVLGLRAMYFLLAKAVDRFHLLKPALGLVLVFVGVKMAWHWWFEKPMLPVVASLSIVLGTVILGIALSLSIPPRVKTVPPAA